MTPIYSIQQGDGINDRRLLLRDYFIASGSLFGLGLDELCPNKLSPESQNRVNCKLHILYQNVGQPSFMCKFIFWFPCVEQFGHDGSSNEGTITFFSTILGIFPSPPK